MVRVTVDPSADQFFGQRGLDVLIETDAKVADLFCPISGVIMTDPVIAEDGETYNRPAIEWWLDEHDTSPTVRDTWVDEDGKNLISFIPMGKTLQPNVARMTAIEKLLEEFNHERGPETVTWDAHGLQQFLPDGASRTVTLSVPDSAVAPPAESRAVADITADLTKMFKVLDPLRNELKTPVNLTPPKIVVIGDELAGKSTILEQLIRMPLFPRKSNFCTRLPIHVRMRRPDDDDLAKASVTLSVITTENYQRHGRDAEPVDTPVTIAIANGYQYVQDKMDELEKLHAGETGGIVSNRIIVLDVLHPEVPVLDLIDLPGMVTVNVDEDGKREAVEKVISEQIKADSDAGMTSFYLVVVPASAQPRTSYAVKYIQQQGLLDRAIGVFTKVDKAESPQKLLAYITGRDVEDEFDGSMISAKSLGEVTLNKGWTATMLAPPILMVDKGGKKVNYYVHHATERLKKQEDDEKIYFGADGAPPAWRSAMRELYDAGLAGTGALAAKLTREYYCYTRGEWLQTTLKKLFEFELELKYERALLGETDPQRKDTLAADEVARTLEDGTGFLTPRFMANVVLGQMATQIEQLVIERASTGIPAAVLDTTLTDLRESIEKIVKAAADQVETFYADEILKLLNAPIEVGSSPTQEEVEPVVPSLRNRFFQRADKMFRSLLRIDKVGVELHKQVVESPLVALAQYPEYTNAIASSVRGACGEASIKIHQATQKICEQIDASVSKYINALPNATCDHATIEFIEGSDGNKLLLSSLKSVFMRFLPNPTQLQSVVHNSGLQLSSFEEDRQAKERRDAFDERITRVRDAARGLIEALDFNEDEPLDVVWLRALLEGHGLPTDDPVVTYEAERATSTPCVAEGTQDED